MNTGQKPVYWEIWNPNKGKTLAAPLSLRCSSSSTSLLFVPPKLFFSYSCAVRLQSPLLHKSKAQMFLASYRGLFWGGCAVFQVLLMRSELETCWVFAFVIVLSPVGSMYCHCSCLGLQPPSGKNTLFSKCATGVGKLLSCE